MGFEDPFAQNHDQGSFQSEKAEDDFSDLGGESEDWGDLFDNDEGGFDWLAEPPQGMQEKIVKPEEIKDYIAELLGNELTDEIIDQAYDVNELMDGLLHKRVEITFDRIPCQHEGSVFIAPEIELMFNYDDKGYRIVGGSKRYRDPGTTHIGGGAFGSAYEAISDDGNTLIIKLTTLLQGQFDNREQGDVAKTLEREIGFDPELVKAGLRDNFTEAFNLLDLKGVEGIVDVKDILYFDSEGNHISQLDLEADEAIVPMYFMTVMEHAGQNMNVLPEELIHQVNTEFGENNGYEDAGIGLYSQGRIDIITERVLPRMHAAFDNCIKGLTYLHENGRVHRDLKPDNIAEKGLIDVAGIASNDAYRDPNLQVMEDFEQKPANEVFSWAKTQLDTYALIYGFGSMPLTFMNEIGIHEYQGGREYTFKTNILDRLQGEAGMPISVIEALDIGHPDMTEEQRQQMIDDRPNVAEVNEDLQAYFNNITVEQLASIIDIMDQW